ncbi:MAG: hypothetical protein LBR41_02865 [Rickettsiales bacterium]|jgi:Sec-independent protein translocase protein TatA|nr:hypothetical protein [Rickettsiales bacterium]
MFGISGAEFLIVLIIAVVVIPARDWPRVAKFLARAVKWVRDLIWKITDTANEIQTQIEREAPIAALSKKTFDEVADAFRKPLSKTKTQMSSHTKRGNLYDVQNGLPRGETAARNDKKKNAKK